MKKGRKLLQGLVVAAGLIFITEMGARSLWGRPPSSDTILRTIPCSIRTEGEQSWMECAEGAAHRVDVPPKGERPRVIALGGSSVRDPFKADPNDNFPEHLQALLPEVEVINMGKAGNSMAAVAWLVSQIESLKPDLLILYEAHNDYAQTVFRGEIAGVRLWQVPIERALQRSWIYAGLLSRKQGFDATTARVKPGAVPLPALCRDVPRSNRRGIVPTDDPSALDVRDAVSERFRDNLTLAIESSPAPVLVSTVLRNFDYAPSGTLTDPTSTCAAALACLGEEHKGKWAEYRDLSVSLCGEDAAVSLWLDAHAREEAGDHDGAIAAWRKSLAVDPVPVRAPYEADVIVREVAAGAGATLVDLEVEVGPLPPGDLFTDTLHLSTAGAQRVAEILAPKVKVVLGR